jgi:SAM-dependent methyltransferase
MTAVATPRPDLIEADVSQPLETVPIQFDAVLALDVLEHLDDDRAAVRRLEMLVRPGGVLILSVPALPDLFSEFDAVQGHRRRYLREAVQAMFEGSQLQIEQLFWWGRWLVPALTRQRARPRSRPGESPARVYRHYLALPPWPFPSLARLAFQYEQERALRGRLEIGTSLFAVARKVVHGAMPRAGI